MISKFPAVELHVQAERRSRAENAVSLSTHRRAKEGLDLEGSGTETRGLGLRDERRALTIAGRRDWNWESSGQPRPSRKSKYRLQTRKSIPARNIYRQRVTLVTRSFRRNNEVFPGKNWVARVRVSFLSTTPLSIDTFTWLHRCDRAIRAPESTWAKEISRTRRNKFCTNPPRRGSHPSRMSFGPAVYSGDGYTLHFPCEWTRPRTTALRERYLLH